MLQIVLLYMLFNLFLANITTLLYFCFLFLNSFFTIAVKIENAKLKLALTIPTGAAITVPNDATEIYQLLQIRRLMTYQNIQKKHCIYLAFYLLIFFL